MSSNTIGDEWLIDDIMYINPDETGVENDVTLNDYELAVANYPNPFNPRTTISYQLPLASDVKLDVYDVSGRLVQSLVNERQVAGEYSVPFNATDLPSGVYVYQLTAADVVASGKMLLVK
ncbi:T9SS type A sorting domain-containing protein [candidate division KSB1 bacterium]|nr:T9SS type A sorting domain-containing protein [candidate division KSB1 bacterium]